MNIGIIGCGNIGCKRAESIEKDDVILGCADIDLEKASKFQRQYNISFSSSNYKDILKITSIDVVFVCTSNNMLREIAVNAIASGKHVLIEKPGGENARDIITIISETTRCLKKVCVGYNHRYHPAILQAKQIINSNGLGELMFCRGLYGHGGRVGMENEWRAKVGELSDQGSHLIDLAGWFIGNNWTEVQGKAIDLFWENYHDDNAFLILTNDKHKTAFLHASCTEWRNMFQFEIYGNMGKLRIDGLGNSYGIEKLTYYDMRKRKELPEIVSWEFPEKDNSWNLEWINFKKSIMADEEPSSSLYNALNIMTVVEKINKTSKT